MDRGVGQIGGTLAAIEDEIRAHLQQPAAAGGKRFNERGGGAGIDGHGQIGLRFSPIDGGVGPRVEDPVGLMGMNRASAGFGIGQVEFSATGGDQGDAIGNRSREGLAELAIAPGEQNPHDPRPNTSPASIAWARVGASASLAESSASCPSSASVGQVMPIAGSFQSSERSQVRFQKPAVL